jgi:hypothetical protein
MSPKLRGNHLCVAIMAACRRDPATAEQLAQAFGHPRDVVLHWTTGMVRVGMLRVVEWRPAVAGKGPRAAVYAFGPGPNAEPLKPRKVRAVSMANLAALGALWEQLQGEPATFTELCDSSGLAAGTVRRLLAAMRSGRLVRRAGWQMRVGCGGSPTPLYQAGANPDAPRPKPLPGKVHSKNWYDRQKTAGSQAKRIGQTFFAMLEAA